MDITVKSNLPEDDGKIVNIKVFGVGGGGNNAINRMAEIGVRGATLVAVNTDIPVLRLSKANEIIGIGQTITKGRGAGANPEIGREAAEESREDIRRALEGVDMLYITAGMGGGTGTGAAPVIAKIAREMQILTVAVVTKPFAFEGKQRTAVAEDGIEKLKQYVDALIVVSNERLREISDTPITFKNAFAEADGVLISSVKSICELIDKESYVNLDFADVTTILQDSGEAHIGIGEARGPQKAAQAAEQAIQSPLLDTSIESAEGIIISIRCDENVGVDEINAATTMITDKVNPGAKIIWGIDFVKEESDFLQIVVIATKMGGERRIAIVDGEVEDEQAVVNAANDNDGNGAEESRNTPSVAATAQDNQVNAVNPAVSPDVEAGDAEDDDDDLFTSEEFEQIKIVANNSTKK